MLAELKRRKVQVTVAHQLLVNAVFVSATRETADQLRSIPGVDTWSQFLPPLHTRPQPRARPGRTFRRLERRRRSSERRRRHQDRHHRYRHRSESSRLSRIPPHAALGFPKGDTAYTNSKVIVARSYVPLVVTIPRPDGTTTPDDYSPRDRMGHGTAIAMIAAGVQNTGPLGTIQGVAPKAFLGNYKIFGSPGINEFTLRSRARNRRSRRGQRRHGHRDALGQRRRSGRFSARSTPATRFAASHLRRACAGGGERHQAGMTVVAAAGNGGNIGQETSHAQYRPYSRHRAQRHHRRRHHNCHVCYQTVRVNGTSGNLRGLFGDGPRIIRR